MRARTLRRCPFVASLLVLAATFPAQAADLFVSGVDSANVVRFDGKTGKRVSVFVPSRNGGLSGVHGITFGPDGHLYVNNRNRHSILRYHGRTGALIDTFVPAGTGGLDTNIGILFGPDGHLYVSCFYQNRVMRFHGKTGEFLDDFVASGSGGLNGAYGMTFGPDGNLYVASHVSHTVLCYDGRTGAFLREIFSPGTLGIVHPIGVTFGPDGHLYVTGRDSNFVARFHGATGAYLGQFVPEGSGLIGGAGLRFGPDGHLYVISGRTHNVLRFHGQTGAPLGVFAAGDLSSPNWLTFSPPEAPTELTAAQTGTHVALSWRDNSDDEFAFEIERRVGGALFTPLGRVAANVTSAIDTAVFSDTPVEYRVRAVGPTGPSVWAESVALTVSVGGTLRIVRRLVLPRTAVGGTSAQTLFIQNPGPGVLSGLVSSLSPPFGILFGGGRYSIPPGGWLPVVVTFSPLVVGDAISTLVITSSDPREPVLYVRVEGDGAPFE